MTNPRFQFKNFFIQFFIHLKRRQNRLLLLEVKFDKIVDTELLKIYFIFWLQIYASPASHIMKKQAPAILRRWQWCTNCMKANSSCSLQAHNNNVYWNIIIFYHWIRCQIFYFFIFFLLKFKFSLHFLFFLFNFFLLDLDFFLSTSLNALRYKIFHVK